MSDSCSLESIYISWESIKLFSLLYCENISAMLMSVSGVLQVVYFQFNVKHAHQRSIVSELKPMMIEKNSNLQINVLL